MTLPLLFTLLAFTTYRIARLVTKDYISEKPRTWLIRKARRTVGKYLATLIGCPFCVGVHVAGWLTLAVWLVRDDGLPLPLLWPLAVAGVQSILTAVDGKLAEH